MAGLYVFAGLTIQHRALLQRRLEFGKLNAIAALAPIVGAVAAIGVAHAGGGYWALVTVPAVTQLTTCLGTWCACPWRPGPPRRKIGTRQMLAFGGHVTVFHFINYLFRNADNAMLGYVWGSGPLGLYSRAYSLTMLPANKFNTPITQVVVPALSRLQDSPERYRDTYQRAIRLVAAMTAIPTTLLILVAPEIIPLLLGKQWNEVVPIFVALGPAAIMAGTNVAGGWLYLSFGHVARQTRWAVISSLFLLAPIVFTLQYGVLAVAIAVSVSRLLIQLPSVSFACPGTPVRLRDYVNATFFVVMLPFLAACAAGLTYSWIACRFWMLEPSLSHFWVGTTLPLGASMNVMILKVALMLGILLLAVLIWPAARNAYYQTFLEWQRFRGKRQRKATPPGATNEETT
jgi:PST family polysaccharide transporter